MELASTSPEPLSAADVARYREDGFLVVPAVCEGAELARIGAILRGLFRQQAGRAEGNQHDMLGADHVASEALQPQLVRPSLYAPVLLHTSHFARVRAIALQLLGDDAQFSFDHSILKPAGRIAATPWHQDEAHNDDALFEHRQISFWMPLADVTEENGCMRYVPGSQRGALLPHRPLDDDVRIHALECTPGSYDDSAAVARPVGAGACILHDGRTLHSARANRSDADRLAYIVVFRAPPVPRRVPARFAWLVAQRTASLERSLRWRLRGGFLVLMARWLQRNLSSDADELWLRLRRLAYRGLAAARPAWRSRRSGGADSLPP